MGRHSAPDEPDLDSADTTEITPIAVDLTVPRGRHSQQDGDESADEFATIEIAPLPAAPPETAAPEAAAPPSPPYAAPPGEKPDKKAAKQAEKQARDRARAQEKADKADKRAGTKADKKARGESGTRADLRILRQNGAVRAQALAAVIVSFLLYTIVMVVIGHTDVYLQWLWIPIVLSGFLVGLVLDLGHRRANKS